MNRTHRAQPEVNASSMADVAFLLLIFFLMVTTINVDTGLARKLPPFPKDKTQLAASEIAENNIFELSLNASGQLICGNEYLPLEELKSRVKTFVLNNGTDSTLSDKPDKAVISLKCDRDANYEVYMNVQNELNASYREMRDETALRQYGLPFKDLDRYRQSLIRNLLPMKISEAEPDEKVNKG